MASSITRKTLRISGMTCVNCQNRIARKLRGTAGVIRASVSYSKGTADITYDADVVSLRTLTDVIEALDYDVLPERGSGSPGAAQVIPLLVIIMCLYILLQRFGVLNLLAPSQLADTGMSYGMLFVIGLITSVHCIAMCGGINLSQCVPRNQEDAGRGGIASTVMPALLYNLGRVISYTLIGFLLGLVGSLAGGGSQAGLSSLLQGILKLIAGTLMVIMGVNMLGLFPWLRRLAIRPPKFLSEKIRTKKVMSGRPLVVGLLNGLMPCGPLQSMQLVALASGSPFAGALSMLLFSLGTVPLMLGLGSIVSALGKRFTQAVMNVGAILVVVLGLAMLSQGGSLSGLMPPDRLLKVAGALCIVAAAASLPFRKRAHRIAGMAAACAAALVLACWGSWSTDPGGTPAGTAELADGVQVVSSTLAPGAYPSITVQSGIPVKWVINAPPGSINGCNYKMILREYGIEHTFQEGENIIQFTPTEAGTIQYSCWMGMIHGTIFVITDPNEVRSAGAAAISAASCCG